MTQRPLSDRLEELRVWCATYAHDGIELAPLAVCKLTGVIADLKAHALETETLMRQVHATLVQVRTEAMIERAHDRLAMEDALAAAGLDGGQAAAAPLLTEEQLADPRIVVFPGRRDAAERGR